jgi:hypothetical protein
LVQITLQQAGSIVIGLQTTHFIAIEFLLRRDLLVSELVTENLRTMNSRVIIVQKRYQFIHWVTIQKYLPEIK